MHGLKAMIKRELIGYFSTPLAYVFMAIFLLLTGIFTFYFGNFYERGQADLFPFFTWHPWLYLFLIPAITMRLWAEERKSGTIELLFTQPLTLWQLVLGKFFAAWICTAIALGLTFPIWLTVNYLGHPDNGVILAGYIGSLLMAAAYISIGLCISATSKNQVIAFIITLVVCFLFTLSGYPLVLDFFDHWLPQFLLDTISSFSFLTNFDEISKGVMELSSIAYFILVSMFWLALNTIILLHKKSH